MRIISEEYRVEEVFILDADTSEERDEAINVRLLDGYELVKKHEMDQGDGRIYQARMRKFVELIKPGEIVANKEG